MNLADILEIRSLAQFPGAIRVLSEAEHADDAFCIVADGINWMVYYIERGNRSFERSFDKESDACKYLYALLLKYGRITE